MLRLSLRTLFSLTPSRSRSPYSILIARCSSSSPPHLTDPHSHSHPDPSNVRDPHSHSHPDPSNVRVSVWWDLDKCNVRLSGWDEGFRGEGFRRAQDIAGFRVAKAITATIKSFGIKGPIEIKAFGDMARLPKTTQGIQDGLYSAIQFSHIPPDYSAHSSLFIGLMGWVSRNPPPAHIFLIVADGGCANLVHHLRMRNYNILLASKEHAPIALCNAATIMWDWDVLVSGGLGYLTGRYFNRPPKWYDHYDGPLDEPLIFSEDYFWRDMETFFKTERGYFIIKESRDRSEMAYHLQKDGPSVLGSLPIIDVLFVVDKLIRKNNWVLQG